MGTFLERRANRIRFDGRDAIYDGPDGVSNRWPGVRTAEAALRMQHRFEIEQILGRKIAGRVGVARIEEHPQIAFSQMAKRLEKLGGGSRDVITLVREVLMHAGVGSQNDIFAVLKDGEPLLKHLFRAYEGFVSEADRARDVYWKIGRKITERRMDLSDLQAVPIPKTAAPRAAMPQRGDDVDGRRVELVADGFPAAFEADGRETKVFVFSDGEWRGVGKVAKLRPTRTDILGLARTAGLAPVESGEATAQADASSPAAPEWVPDALDEWFRPVKVVSDVGGGQVRVAYESGRESVVKDASLNRDLDPRRKGFEEVTTADFTGAANTSGWTPGEFDGAFLALANRGEQFPESTLLVVFAARGIVVSADGFVAADGAMPAHWSVANEDFAEVCAQWETVESRQDALLRSLGACVEMHEGTPEAKALAERVRQGVTLSGGEAVALAQAAAVVEHALKLQPLAALKQADRMIDGFSVEATRAGLLNPQVVLREAGTKAWFAHEGQTLQGELDTALREGDATAHVRMSVREVGSVRVPEVIPVAVEALKWAAPEVERGPRSERDHVEFRLNDRFIRLVPAQTADGAVACEVSHRRSEAEHWRTLADVLPGRRPPNAVIAAAVEEQIQKEDTLALVQKARAGQPIELSGGSLLSIVPEGDFYRVSAQATDDEPLRFLADGSGRPAEYGSKLRAMERMLAAVLADKDGATLQFTAAETVTEKIPEAVQPWPEVAAVLQEWEQFCEATERDPASMQVYSVLKQGIERPEDPRSLGHGEGNAFDSFISNFGGLIGRGVADYPYLEAALAGRREAEQREEAAQSQPARLTRPDGRWLPIEGDKVRRVSSNSDGLAVYAEGTVIKGRSGETRVRIERVWEALGGGEFEVRPGATELAGTLWNVVGAPNSQIPEPAAEAEPEPAAEAEPEPAAEAEPEPAHIPLGIYEHENGGFVEVVESDSMLSAVAVDASGVRREMTAAELIQSFNYVGPRKSVPPGAGPDAPDLPEEERDYTFVPGERERPRGRVTRIQGNVQAIRLLKTLEEEDRLPNAAEKEVLARYNGWGADKEVFNEAYVRVMNEPEDSYTAMYVRQSNDFQSWDKNYGRFSRELKRLLTEDEWKSAAASTLNAHYTPDTLAGGLWDIARKLGFQGGRVVDLGMGTGTLTACMPADMRARSKITGVELDSLTSRISKKLYPQMEVLADALEDAPLPRGGFDLAILNPPFSEHGPGVQPGEKIPLNLHNFFISKAIDSVKPGGVALVITSASTMQNNVEQRQVLASKSELLGAMRLPAKALAADANTEVVVDVLVLRRKSQRVVPHESWVHCVPVDLPEEGMVTFWDASKGDQRVDKAFVNEYFVRNPERVLGFHSMKGEMYGRQEKGQYTVTAAPDSPSFEQGIKDLAAALPGNILGDSRQLTDVFETEPAEKLMALKAEKQGAFVVRDEAVYVVNEFRELVDPDWRKDPDWKGPRGMKGDRAEEIVRRYVGLREALKTVLATDLNPLASSRMSEATRERLRAGYEEFVKEVGQLNSNPSFLRLLETDPDVGMVMALEQVRAEGEGRTKKLKITPSEILFRRTLFPAPTPTPANATEAIFASIGMRGCVDTGFIAELLGCPDDDSLHAEMLATGLVFRDPMDGKFVAAANYLSGDVVTKLQQAKAEAARDSRFAANVDALERVQPEPMTISEISANLGAPWIPTRLYEEFARVSLGISSPSIAYNKILCDWTVESGYSFQADELWGVGDYGASAMLRNAMLQKNVRIYREVDDGDKIVKVLDGKATAQAQDLMRRIRESWNRFVFEEESRKKQIVEVFNAKYNRFRTPVYDGTYLQLSGISQGKDALTPRPHQRDVVQRIIEEQCGLIAHDVGYGKTLSLITGAWESKRMGLASKVMIVCDNASYPQFAATVRTQYPQAKVLVAESDSMSARKRQSFLARIATEDWDFVVVPHSQFDMMPVREVTEQKFLAQELQDIEEVLVQQKMQQGSSRRNNGFTRRLEKKKEAVTRRMEALLERSRERKDRGICFEDLGVDLLMVDEAHKYKKLPFQTSHQNVKGIDTGQSQRGMNMLMKARSIQEKREGRGVILATATPVTNTMAEAWNMIRLASPETLKQYDVERFDSFVATFTEMVTGMELNEANLKWRNVSRLSRFTNGHIFVQMIREAFDVRMDKAAVKLDIPERKGGEIELTVVEQTDGVAAILEGISSIYEAYESTTGEEKQEIGYVPIMLMQVNMAAAIDPRLINPEAPDEPNSVVNVAVERMARIYAEEEEEKGVQAVFLDRYSPMDTSILEQVRTGGLSAFYDDVDDSVEDLDAPSAGGKGSEAEDEQPAEEVSVAEMRRAIISGLGRKYDPEDKAVFVKKCADMSPEEIKELYTSPAMDFVRFRKSFNLYHDIRDKLVAKGIPAGEIAIMTDYAKKEDRMALFERVNRGEVRIVMGSTVRLGTGVNIQKRLCAMHHLDPARDMTPASMHQRSGRGIRNGNEYKEVAEIYYGMKDTAIPGVLHRIQRKGGFIAQTLSGVGVGASFEDDAQGVRLEEMKSCLISDKRQAQREEILAEIRDQRGQRDLIAQRERQLEREKDRLEASLARCHAQTLPAANELASWTAENVKPPSDMPEDEPFSLTIDGEDVLKDAKVRDFKSVRKLLQKWIEDVKLRMASGELGRAERDLASVELNGLSFKIRKEVSGWGKERIIADVPHPVSRVRSWQHFQVGSGEAILKVVDRAAEAAKGAPASAKADIRKFEGHLDHVMREISRTEPFDSGRLQELELELEALEIDMRENPFKSRSERRKEIQEAGRKGTPMENVVEGEVIDEWEAKEAKEISKASEEIAVSCAKF